MKSNTLPAVTTAILLATGCPQGNTKNTAAQARPAGSVRNGVVVIEGATRSVRVQAEIVATKAARARGLMFRRELPASAGMLFIFDEQAVHPFWMKNTYIPLDIIFIDDQWKVVGVLENTAPMTTNSLEIESPSRYVLEVNAGFSRKHGIRQGSAVKLIED